MLEFPPVAVVTDVNGSEMLVTVVPVSETVVVKVEILLSVVELCGILAAGFDDRGILVVVKVEILLSCVELFGMLAAGFDDRGILVAVHID